MEFVARFLHGIPNSHYASQNPNSYSVSSDHLEIGLELTMDNPLGNPSI